MKFENIFNESVKNRKNFIIMSYVMHFFKSHFSCLTNLNHDQFAKFSYTCSDKANYCGRNINNSTNNKYPASELRKGDTHE